MKAVGITAEYNPMHTGHIWQLQEAKRLSGASCAVAVMSGDFVQRGTPAVFDKYSRARAALLSGADLVLELPSVYAVSSAEMFALGAIRTFRELSVDFLSFGSESTDLSLMERIARIFDEEPDDYKSQIKSGLCQGKSFPAAREEALLSALKTRADAGHSETGIQDETVRGILRSSNDILGIEYIKASVREKCGFTFIPVRRIGAAHDQPADTSLTVNPDCGLSDTGSSAGTLSASAIRRFILENQDGKDTGSEDFMKCLAPSLAAGLREHTLTPLAAGDFTQILYAKIEEILYRSDYNKTSAAKALTAFEDVSESIGMSLVDRFDPSLSIGEYVDSVKNRSLTHARIARCLLHILLDITKETAERYRQKLPYIRILGFTKTGQEYLHEHAREVSCPLITKTADYKNLFSEDRHAANLYRQVLEHKSGKKYPDEFRSGIIRI
ncbi:MAG: nucleotidyltransferase family protein [Lachnospiraceae bacterium]